MMRGTGHDGGGWARRAMRPGALDDERERGRGAVYDHRVVTRLMAYVAPYRRQVALSLLAMGVTTFTIVAQPWIIKVGIDAVVDAPERGDVGALPWALALFVGNILLRFVFNVLYQVSLARMSQQVLYALRAHIFAHLQRLSVSFYDRNEVGRVMSRGQNDVNQLQEFLNLVVTSLADLLSLGGIVVAMLLLDVQLALITLTVAPALLAVMVVWQRYAWGAFMAVRQAIAVVNAALQENIAGVRVVQALNREDANLGRFESVNRNHLEANLRASRLSAALMPTVEALTAAAIALVVVFGGMMALDGALEVSVIVAFVLYVQRFFDPIRNLTMQYTQFQRAMTSGVRIFALLDTPAEVQDAPDAAALPPVRGDVAFEDVRFHYTPGAETLRGVSLRARAGETVALVGETGAGKTTMVSLLNRFYDVTGGRITIDGYDVREVTQASLARQRAMVLQEPFLFSGSVRDNIAYNRADAPQEAVEAAAQAVGAHEFIVRLPEGYATRLQERGQNLSLGQRQLISLARALLADPRLLVLDEATASIDSASERRIQEALTRVLAGRTSVVIAHRLSTIVGADRIVVMQGGEAVEEGDHATLLARDGAYARLYRAYAAAVRNGSGEG